MTAVAVLVVHLAVAAAPLALSVPPPVPPAAGPLDPGPFQGRELVAAGGGVLVGDALAVGVGYGTLQLFVNHGVSPSADNFRRAAYVLGAAALIVPPLVATLFATWARAGPASGHPLKAYLLATVAHAGALLAGYLAAPNYWVTIPVQLAGVAAGTSLGLHWGPRRTAAPAARPGANGPASPAHRSEAVAALSSAYCPIR